MQGKLQPSTSLGYVGRLRNPQVTVGQIISSLLPCPGGCGVGDKGCQECSGSRVAFPCPLVVTPITTEVRMSPATMSPSRRSCRVGDCPRGCPSACVAPAEATGPGRDGSSGSLLSHCAVYGFGQPRDEAAQGAQAAHPGSGPGSGPGPCPRCCLGILQFQKGLAMPRGFPAGAAVAQAAVPADAFCSRPRAQ